MFEGSVEVSGARLHVRDTGGEGAAVVLCHPASQNAAIWRAYQEPAFAAAGFRVVSYSRRGYEGSDEGAPGESGSIVADLAAVLDARGIERAHLLGAAAGGIAALGFAVAFPARARSLVLAGTIFRPDEAEWRAFFARLGIGAVKDHVPVEFLELGPAYRAANPEGTAEFARLSAAATAGGRPEQPLGVKVTWAAMEALDLPVLLLTGEADLYAPPPLQALVAPHFARPETQTMPAIGHAPFWEAPADFNARVLAFWQRLALAG